MKNKIALISYHNEYNYGTMLQAYALYRALQMRGVDSEYISYQISIPSLKQRLFQGLIRYLSHPEKLYTKFAVRKENNQNDFSFFKTEDFKTTIDAFNQWYKEYIPHTHIVYFTLKGSTVIKSIKNSKKRGMTKSRQLFLW